MDGQETELERKLWYLRSRNYDNKGETELDKNYYMVGQETELERKLCYGKSRNRTKEKKLWYEKSGNRTRRRTML